MDRPNKDAMLLALAEAKVGVSETASIAQIRTLYESLPNSANSTDLPDDRFITSDNVSNVASTSSVAPAAPAGPVAPAVPAVPAASAESPAPYVTAGIHVLPAAPPTTLVASTTLPNSIVDTPSVSPPMWSAESAATPAVISAFGPSTYNTAAAVGNYADGDLDAELSRLRKQMEIIKLCRELSDVKQFEPSFKVDISSIEAMIPVFTGDGHYDVNKWINDLEDAFVILRFDDRAKLVGCRRRLDGTAKIFLRTIATPSYEVLKQLLLDEFGRVHTLQEVYETLKNRRRKPGESLKRYVLEMQEIALQALVPEAEVVDFIIRGINDNSNAGAMLYAANSIKELKHLLERYERYCLKDSKLPAISRMNISVS